MTAELAVAGWVWATTTGVGVCVTIVLVGFLGADVIAAAIAPTEGRLVADKSTRRRRIERAAAVIGALFVVVVAVRFALIFIDYPGPGR